jgi:phosphoglycerol transferase
MLTRKQVHQNQQRHYLRATVRFVTYLCAFFLASIAYWVTSNFGKSSLEQVLYHAQFGMEGLVTTDTGIVRNFIATCLALPVSVALLLVLIEYSIALTLIYSSKHWFAKPMKIFNLHGLRLFYWFISHRAPLYTLVVCVIYFALQFSISAFVHNQFGKDYFGDHYVYPQTIKIEPLKTDVKPKNYLCRVSRG